MLQHVLVGRFEQVAARVRVSESSDAQAVGRVKLAEEELAASVPHPVELQQARCREQRLGKEVRQLQVEKYTKSTLPYDFGYQVNNLI